MTREKAFELAMQACKETWSEKTCVEIMKALEQEPCEDCCNGNQIEKAKLCQKSYLAGMEHKQEPKIGYWISDLKLYVYGKDDYHCSICGRTIRLCRPQEQLTDYPYCHCGAKMQESEVEERSEQND